MHGILHTMMIDDYFSGYCEDPVLGLSQHEIDVCSEYVHAFMGLAFRGFFKKKRFFE